MWLKVHPQNPRWFSDDSGRATVLTGFHTWNNLVEMRPGEAPSCFDYPQYLEKLSAHGHNCIRLWAWDALCSWNPKDRVDTFPWSRTGPGDAVDGRPKFDLARLDDSYFERLKSRVKLAEERGIYVMVMLFESWASSDITSTPNDWHVFSHPNNINGVDVASKVEEGWMVEWMALASPEVTRLQEAYVSRVVESLADAPNVLYEISNEAGRLSFAWQESFTSFIRGLESGRSHRHLVGISGGMDTRCDEFFGLNSDWLSPEGWVPDGEPAPYRDGLKRWGEPPESGSKPLILDTDHLWGIGGDSLWAWRSFLNGYHPLYMDVCDDFEARIFEHPWWPDSRTDYELRGALGAIQKASGLLDLGSLVPQPEIASSGFALVGPDGFIALVEEAGTVSPAPERFTCQWMEPASGRLSPPDDFEFGPQGRELQPDRWSILIGRRVP